MAMDRIILGSDHAGFMLKEVLKQFLLKKGHKIEDVGTHFGDPCDYPKNAAIVAKKVLQSKGKAKGILVCGSGLGETIVANKFRGIRATNCFDEYTAHMAREHNDANVLCLGARILSAAKAKNIAQIFLSTKMSSEPRHRRRVGQIVHIEKRVCR